MFDKHQVKRNTTSQQIKDELSSLGNILLPHQLNRLNELYFQYYGMKAILDPYIAIQLEISLEQREEIVELQNEYLKSNSTQAEREFETNVFDILTDEQKQKSKEIHGDVFDFEKS